MAREKPREKDGPGSSAVVQTRASGKAQWSLHPYRVPIRHVRDIGCIAVRAKRLERVECTPAEGQEPTDRLSSGKRAGDSSDGCDGSRAWANAMEKHDVRSRQLHQLICLFSFFPISREVVRSPPLAAIHRVLPGVMVDDRRLGFLAPALAVLACSDLSGRARQEGRRGLS